MDTKIAARDQKAECAGQMVYLSTPYFASLDVLRAFAILAVVWHHTAAPAFANPLAHKGFHGVTLFFAISGFLIVTLLLREKRRTNDIAIRAFMVKRALRILPLYYATLLAYVLLVGLIEKDGVAKAQFFANLPAFATFTTNWFVEIDAPRVIFYFAWTLAAEEQFYLVWPWIERAKMGRHFSLAVAIIAVALSPDFLGGFWAHTEAPPFVFEALSRVPGAIGLGVILAHVLHEPALFRVAKSILGRRGSAAMLITALLAVVASDGALGLAEAAVIDILCAAIVGAAVIRADNDLSVLARVPGLIHIGVVSYGVYLLHMLSANSVTRLGRELGLEHGVILFAATMAVAVIAATISHATFERWFLRQRSRFLGEGGPAKTVATHPAAA